MDDNEAQNQSYWCVLREDQNNVLVFSSNNFAIQNSQASNSETRCMEAGDIEIGEPIRLLPTGAPEEATKCKFWHNDKIKLLLSLTTGNETGDLIKEYNIWAKIGAILNISPEICAKKYRILRSTFIRLTKNKCLGKDIKWVHYNLCKEAFKHCKTLPLAVFETWDDNKIKKMLSLYIDSFDHYQTVEKRDLWKKIAKEIGTTENDCYHQFLVLKRTYRRCYQRNRVLGKHVKWPYYSYFERILYNEHPQHWKPEKIKLLLQNYANVAYKFKNPKFKKKELWREIADAIGEAPTKCEQKYRNLKYTYFKLKERAVKGSVTTKWSYFKDFQLLESMCPQDVARGDSSTKVKNYIHQLLAFYLEKKEQFRNPLKKKLHLWSQIGSKIGLCPYECDKKFRNLKRTYLQLKRNKQLTGKTVKWPYYSYFEKIFDVPEKCKCIISVDNIMLKEIRRVVHEVDERRQKDEKFERLMQAAEESNRIQREKNRILLALLNRKT